jgi:hypothetical protein
MDEPWPDDILAVTCLRADEMQSVVPGSLVKTCWRCECSVWLSPATRDHVRDKPHRILCMPCAMEMAAKDKDPQMAPVTSGQLEELKQVFEAKGLPPPTAEELEELRKALQAEGIFPPSPPHKRH